MSAVLVSSESCERKGYFTVGQMLLLALVVCWQSLAFLGLLGLYLHFHIMGGWGDVGGVFVCVCVCVFRFSLSIKI